jgi:hypothetical protein
MENMRVWEQLYHHHHRHRLLTPLPPIITTYYPAASLNAYRNMKKEIASLLATLLTANYFESRESSSFVMRANPI